MKIPFVFAIALALLPACASTSSPKIATAYVSIDEGVYPTFNLQKPGNPENVVVKVPADQVAKWKAAVAAYIAAQKEMEAAVNHYEPLKIQKLKANRTALAK
jgi:hypothetical protein